ncbi:Na+/H+ antiporter [Rhizobium sp. S152]|uniref:Na+/H+ antiporter n=1 Tax=Rhizobium sp. S152 TaxID=3055038 RepID=UPI0025A97075|nr:Na+/H+ antiporter [Rhizobium sp. S152]MDM9627789.1 Na+/H+ antiporter [Rhizobium sp. S152]
MEVSSAILLVLFAIVLSAVLGRVALHFIPIPLVQIGVGILFALLVNIPVTLDPEVFFLLFLPPLLFLDGWRIPSQALRRDAVTIVSLAFGLVLFTVVGLGLLIFTVIPDIPLSVAFTIAAILAPTDPIALSAITARNPMSKRLMHVLEGESLFNDASSLVCMKFGIAATATGAISFTDAGLSFVWLVTMGIVVGVATTIVIVRLKNFISGRFGEQSASQILASLLIPFGAYLVAEHLHASGILAAVSAGIVMNRLEQSGQAHAVTRIRRAVVWDSIQFTANGAIFVLLGEQLPRMVATTFGGRPMPESVHLLFYLGVVLAALAVLRFCWVWLSLRVTVFRSSEQAGNWRGLRWRLVSVATVSGVRGAITLAAVLGLPTFLPDGSLLPGRDVAVFLASGVIVMSLVFASVVLPLLLAGSPPSLDPRRDAEEEMARARAAEAAIAAIEEKEHLPSRSASDDELYSEISARIMVLYRRRAGALSAPPEEVGEWRRAEAMEIELRLAAAHAERGEILRLLRVGRLSEETAMALVREVDLAEARLVSRK